MRKWNRGDRTTAAGRALFALEHGVDLPRPCHCGAERDSKYGPCDRCGRPAPYLDAKICGGCGRRLVDERGLARDPSWCGYCDGVNYDD